MISINEDGFIVKSLVGGHLPQSLMVPLIGELTGNSLKRISYNSLVLKSKKIYCLFFFAANC